MDNLRDLRDNTIYYITNRTLGEQHWLKYDEHVVDLAETWLARAAAFFGVKIYFFVIMDNHVHLAVSAALGKTISAFMGYFKSRLSFDINQIRGREGQLWKKRFDAAPILDGTAELERLAYTLLNPVAAGMCRKPETSPVPSAARMILFGQSRTFTYFDRTAWHRAGKPEKNKSRFERKVELKMEPLPSLEQYTEEERTELIQDAIKTHPSNRFVRKCTSRDFAPSDRPRNPKRSPRVKCHTGTLERYLEYVAELKVKVAAYYEAAEQYIKGVVDVVFPEGMFPPSRYPRAQH